MMWMCEAHSGLVMQLHCQETVRGLQQATARLLAATGIATCEMTAVLQLPAKLARTSQLQMSKQHITAKRHHSVRQHPLRAQQRRGSQLFRGIISLLSQPAQDHKVRMLIKALIRALPTAAYQMQQDSCLKPRAMVNTGAMGNTSTWGRRQHDVSATGERYLT